MLKKILVVLGIILILGLGVFIFKEKIFFKTYKNPERFVSLVYSRFWKPYDSNSRTKNTLIELVDTDNQGLVAVYFRLDAIPKYQGSDSEQEKSKNITFLKEQVLKEDSDAGLIKEEDVIINSLPAHRIEWFLTKKVGGQNLRMINVLLYGNKGFDYSIIASTTEDVNNYGSTNHTINSLKQI